MTDAEKFIDWLLENGYLVHETAPRLYNLLKNISDR